MKLIDLLVRELPKRGGWPSWAFEACNQDVGRVMFYNSEGGVDGDSPEIKIEINKNQLTKEEVTREQYEAVLAASQQTAWNGAGLPPVGCICEALAPSRQGEPWTWQRVKVVESGIDGAEKECLVYNIETTRPSWVDEFRPIPTEAECKREEIAQQMCNLFGNGIEINEKEGYGTAWLDVYDAIAAGKIPGVKLI